MAKLPNAHVIDRKSGEDIRTYDFHGDYDVIYHLAANASIPQSIENPQETHTHSVLGTIRVLEYARRIGARVVFSSSSSVYGNPLEVPTTENCPTRPMVPYALQKLECEQYLKLYWDLYGVKGVAFRYMNVFGEGQENANGGGDSALALGNFLGQYRDGKPFTVVGTGEQRRDFIYAGDIAEANIKAAEWLKTAESFEIFNLGSGINHSVNEVCSMISSEHPRVFLPPRIEPPIGLADITKAKKILGWSPTISLESWIDKVKGTGYVPPRL